MQQGQGTPGMRPGGTATGACPQPGCNGQIVDGYCDVCGQPPTASVQNTAAGDGVVPASASSQHLPQTPLGSARSTTSITRPDAGLRLSARTRIGAGLTEVPPAPPVDPAAAVIKNPVVPENRRNCGSCGEPVGRATEEQPEGATQGVCDNCGARFSFDPSIKPGQMVANQYEVAGPIAYGGMGWIYIARDRNVSDRWVVLKGLLNSADKDATAAALAEQQHLAHVEHPLIVEIYNFVEHDGANYIVMEYVPGRSLTQLLKARREANGGQHDPLPVDWALAYLIEIMPALHYMHTSELLYCDFKPDNIMQVGDSLKLIDLGGVRRIDDDDSAIYGTVGFQAPEVPTTGPSIASDVYTVGRTLLFLVAEIKGFQSEFATMLPQQNDVPVLAAEDSLYRLIAKCCAPNPDDRFQSVEEFRVQALGVLREVVGRRTPGPAYTSESSQLFEAPTSTGDTFDWHQLPRLRPDANDPMAGWLASLTIDRPEDRFAALRRAPQQTPQVHIEQIRVMLEASSFGTVSAVIDQMLTSNPWEWRAVWMMGVTAMASGQWVQAQAPFNAVYAQLPGELAPKFALAVACERGDQHALAEHLFAICADTDANYVTPSAFGLARIRSQRGDLKGALDALNLVPGTSSGYSEARRLRAQHLLAHGTTLDQLGAALDSVRAAGLDPNATARYEVEVLTRAKAMLDEQGPQPKTMFAGQPATVRNVRSMLERAYRDLAVYEQDTSDRNRLIDQANSQRRWSLF